MAEAHHEADAPCCTDHADPMPNCHVLAAILAPPEVSMAMSEHAADLRLGYGLLPTGFEPSGPLDPPRA